MNKSIVDHHATSPVNARLKQFETDVVLKDGSLVHVRPARPGDYELITNFVENLTPETCKLRFLKALKLEQAVSELMPNKDQFALLALREEVVIGHAIYTQTLPGRAEHAVVVADPYQNQGLGMILLAQLDRKSVV